MCPCVQRFCALLPPGGRSGLTLHVRVVPFTTVGRGGPEVFETNKRNCMICDFRVMSACHDPPLSRLAADGPLAKALALPRKGAYAGACVFACGFVLWPTRPTPYLNWAGAQPPDLGRDVFMGVLHGLGGGCVLCAALNLKTET